MKYSSLIYKMPNWCSNELIVEGDQDLLQQFYDENRSGESKLTFAKAVPVENNMGYYKWGTKWDASDVEVHFEQSLNYSFETAWSTPELWFEAIVKKYPRLQFTLEYSEPMMDFEGIITGEDGKITENSIWSYDEIRWDELFDSGVVMRYIVEHASNDFDDIERYLADQGFEDDYAYVMERHIEHFRAVHSPEKLTT